MCGTEKIEQAALRLNLRSADHTTDGTKTVKKDVLFEFNHKYKQYKCSLRENGDVLLKSVVVGGKCATVAELMSIPLVK